MTPGHFVCDECLALTRPSVSAGPTLAAGQGWGCCLLPAQWGWMPWFPTLPPLEPPWPGGEGSCAPAPWASPGTTPAGQGGTPGPKATAQPLMSAVQGRGVGRHLAGPPLICTRCRFQVASCLCSRSGRQEAPGPVPPHCLGPRPQAPCLPPPWCLLPGSPVLSRGVGTDVSASPSRQGGLLMPQLAYFPPEIALWPRGFAVLVGRCVSPSVLLSKLFSFFRSRWVLARPRLARVTVLFTQQMPALGSAPEAWGPGPPAAPWPTARPAACSGLGLCAGPSRSARRGCFQAPLQPGSNPTSLCGSQNTDLGSSHSPQLQALFGFLRVAENRWFRPQAVPLLLVASLGLNDDAIGAGPDPGRLQSMAGVGGPGGGQAPGWRRGGCGCGGWQGSW